MTTQLKEKIQKHPRSQAARAFKLGKAEAQVKGLMPLLKPVIRYWMLKGTYLTRKERNEFKRLTTRLEALTK